MGQQYNKVEKRVRRKRYNERVKVRNRVAARKRKASKA